MGRPGPPLSRRQREPLVRQRRPRPTQIAEAVAAQFDQLEAYSAFGNVANRPRSSSPSGSAPSRRWRRKVFLTTGGGEAIDAAAKIARQYWRGAGHPSRQHLIGRIAGYHGTNGFGTSLGGIEVNRTGFGA